MHFEGLAAQLEATGDYRVLRRLQARGPAPDPLPEDARLGIVLDVETTGTDGARDEVIELAMLKFAFNGAGEVLGVAGEFQALNEPPKPITAEITALTGIDDAMVAGHKLDLEAIGAFVAPAHLIVAHNASFDRLFAERLHPHFSTKAWGCSMCEPPWRDEGFEGTKLAYLAAESGFFYSRHRAITDCMATLELLARPLPRSGRPALTVLLERARQTTYRLWAQGAPYDRKDELKGRSYRWNGGEDGRPRAWWVEVTEEQLESELSYLAEEMRCEPIRRKVNAFTRYSARA